jgi:hypothetical protein
LLLNSRVRNNTIGHVSIALSNNEHEGFPGPIRGVTVPVVIAEGDTRSVIEFSTPTYLEVPCDYSSVIEFSTPSFIEVPCECSNVIELSSPSFLEVSCDCSSVIELSTHSFPEVPCVVVVLMSSVHIHF